MNSDSDWRASGAFKSRWDVASALWSLMHLYHLLSALEILHPAYAERTDRRVDDGFVWKFYTEKEEK
jgi:hypothetical protein